MYLPFVRMCIFSDVTSSPSSNENVPSVYSNARPIVLSCLDGFVRTTYESDEFFNASNNSSLSPATISKSLIVATETG